MSNVGGGGFIVGGGPQTPLPTPATVTAADNGLSLDGTTVQLGQDLAAVGDPAIMLNDREIPMGAFRLIFTNPGTVQIGDTFNFGPTLQVTPNMVVGEGNSANRNQVVLNRNTIEVRSNAATMFSALAFTIQDPSFPYNANLFLSDDVVNGSFVLSVADPLLPANYGYMALYYNSGNTYFSNTAPIPDNANQVQVLGKGTLYANQSVGIGVATQTARLHLPASTTAAGSAPVKINTGVLMTTPESGAIEKTADQLYFTQNTGPARRPIPMVQATLGSGNIVYSVTGGLIQDSSNLRYSTADNCMAVGGVATSATTFMVLSAGTTTKAPYRYTAGTNTTVIANGNKEFDGTNEFLSAGGVRYTMQKGLTGSAVLDFPSTAANSFSDLTITVTGAAAGDPVTVGVPIAAQVNNTQYTGFVSAANTVTVRLLNNDAALAADPGSGTFNVFVGKQ